MEKERNGKLGQAGAKASRASRRGRSVLIEITEEMVRRGCEAVWAMGGLPKNRHLSSRMYRAEIREILEVAVGLRELDP